MQKYKTMEEAHQKAREILFQDRYFNSDTGIVKEGDLIVIAPCRETINYQLFKMIFFQKEVTPEEIMHGLTYFAKQLVLEGSEVLFAISAERTIYLKSRAGVDIVINNAVKSFWP